jgi:hypothetical protein
VQPASAIAQLPQAPLKPALQVIEHVRVEERPAAPQAAPQPSQPPLARPQHRPASVVERTIERVAPNIERVGGEPVRRSAAGAAPSERPQTLLPVPPAALGYPPAPLARPATLAPIVVQPQVRRAAVLAHESAPPPAPTIQVTIGRVEVRAARQPEPAARQARGAAAAISLDEYLRQRNGGGGQ